MTAVEFLVSKIASKIDDEYWCNQQNITEYVQQAKEMHKQEIIDAWDLGSPAGEVYYNETYGSKENDTQ
jgi:hypothetical protein